MALLNAAVLLRIVSSSKTHCLADAKAIRAGIVFSCFLKIQLLLDTFLDALSACIPSFIEIWLDFNRRVRLPALLRSVTATVYCHNSANQFHQHCFQVLNSVKF